VVLLLSVLLHALAEAVGLTDELQDVGTTCEPVIAVGLTVTRQSLQRESLSRGFLAATM
jgi:hypothetical protein